MITTSCARASRRCCRWWTGWKWIAEARNGSELVTLVDSLKPDVVMTDISMPGMDGIAAIAEIHARHPDVRLLVLSMYDTVDFVKRAVASGAAAT